MIAATGWGPGTADEADAVDGRPLRPGYRASLGGAVLLAALESVDLRPILQGDPVRQPSVEPIRQPGGLSAAWQVTLIDPVWGRNDVLWPVLKASVASA